MWLKNDSRSQKRAGDQHRVHSAAPDSPRHAVICGHNRINAQAWPGYQIRQIPLGSGPSQSRMKSGDRQGLLSRTDSIYKDVINAFLGLVVLWSSHSQDENIGLCTIGSHDTGQVISTWSPYFWISANNVMRALKSRYWESLKAFAAIEDTDPLALSTRSSIDLQNLSIRIQYSSSWQGLSSNPCSCDDSLIILFWPNLFYPLMWECQTLPALPEFISKEQMRSDACIDPLFLLIECHLLQWEAPLDMTASMTSCTFPLVLWYVFIE